MRLLFLFVIATFLVSATVSERIVGTWEVYKIKGSGNAKKNTPKFQLTFDANGRCTMNDFSERERTKSGKYVCDESTNMLYIEDRPGKDAEPMRIVKLTVDKLILAPEKGHSKGLQRLYLKKVG